MPKEKNTIPRSQTREFWEEQNRKRRERYRNDPVYRTHVSTASRESYRASHKVVRKYAVQETDLQRLGTLRDMVPDAPGNKRRRMVTFNAAEMSEALGGYHTVVFYRWVRTGKFPPPRHDAYAQLGRKNVIKVYTLPEAQKLVSIFRRQQEQKTYFYASDSATVARLFAVLDQS